MTEQEQTRLDELEQELEKLSCAYAKTLAEKHILLGKQDSSVSLRPDYQVYRQIIKQQGVLNGLSS